MELDDTPKMIKQILTLAFTCTLTSAVVHAESNANLVSADDIKWGYLNPLRGDKSPGATDLWGDRTQDVATGMLVRFNKGFSSPPHIHNISYRGIVIEGSMHNDDPTAAQMWMPKGSFWTQPAGEDHITAADGQNNLIYLEIDSGPYLVKPSDQHFDNGQSPVNLHRDNMVWQKLSISGAPINSEVTHLWGSTKLGEIGGSLVKLPNGFNGKISSKANEFKVVVISGELSYQQLKSNSAVTLSPGSYFNSTGQYQHKVSTIKDTVIYVRTNGEYQLVNQ